MRIGGDEAYDTNTPICFEALGDPGTDVGRVGGVAFGCELPREAVSPVR